MVATMTGRTAGGIVIAALQPTNRRGLRTATCIVQTALPLVPLVQRRFGEAQLDTVVLSIATTTELVANDELSPCNPRRQHPYRGLPGIRGKNHVSA